MVRITKAQAISLKRKHIHGDLKAKGISYRNFRASIQATFGCDGAIAVQWCGMWLAIEKDGYVHT
jgi:hypothetical protein